MRAFVLANYMNANFLHVERLPREGESLEARRHVREHGGKGLNLAVGLHRLGVTVDLLMAVGADEAGAAVTHRLAEEGLCTERILTLGAASGFGVGFIGLGGANFLAVHPGANALLTTEHVEQTSAALAEAEWVLAQFESSDSVIRHAFRHARRAGKRTYLNPSPWRPLEAELLALTDVLVVNAAEAAQLFERPGLEAAARAEWVGQLAGLAARLEWRGTLLVVTLGAGGCVALDYTGQVLGEAAYRVRQIDATGAGDAFGAGLVASLLRGLPLAEALRTANACGALVAASAGVLDALPHPSTLQEFMGRRFRR
jgi:ribokinase